MGERWREGEGERERVGERWREGEGERGGGGREGGGYAHWHMYM